MLSKVFSGFPKASYDALQLHTTVACFPQAQKQHKNNTKTTPPKASVWSDQTEALGGMSCPDDSLGKKNAGLHSEIKDKSLKKYIK